MSFGQIHDSVNPWFGQFIFWLIWVLHKICAWVIAKCTIVIQASMKECTDEDYWPNAIGKVKDTGEYNCTEAHLVDKECKLLRVPFAWLERGYGAPWRGYRNGGHVYKLVSWKKGVAQSGSAMRGGGKLTLSFCTIALGPLWVGLKERIFEVLLREKEIVRRWEAVVPVCSMPISEGSNKERVIEGMEQIKVHWGPC